MKTANRISAIEFHAILATVDLAKVPVMSDDRHIERKVQAALARKLFKQLGIPGVSVTTPNYSMASVVDVAIPTRNDYTVRREDGGFDFQEDPAARANTEAERKIETILAIAFPKHDDRSDSMTDYYDSCWSIQRREGD